MTNRARSRRARAVFVWSRWALRDWLAKFAEIGRSGITAAAILSCEAERPAYCIREPVALCLACVVPIFLGGRKRQPQQIGRGGKEASVHPQAKCGALEEAGGSVTGGGPPLVTLFREPGSHPIRRDHRLNLAGQSRPEQISGEAQAGVEHALRSDCLRRIRNALPIDARLARDQR